MNVPIVPADRIRARVSFDALIEPVASAFRASSAGRADNGLIVMYPATTPEAGDVYVKTATLRGATCYVVKVAPWFAGNARDGAPQGGFIAVFDTATGRTLAVLDEQHYLSDIRTAAAGAVAARLFAPPAVDAVAVLGAGVQAYWQSLALHRERPFRTLLLWARNAARAGRLRDRLRVALPDVTVELHQEAEAVVRRADVVVAATSAREPVLRGRWLREGQHVTAVGADDPSKCELDAEALHRARLFVDEIATTVKAGDVHRAIAQGEYSPDQIAGEIGEVLAGAIPGRRSARDITIAKLVGIGALDLVAAEVTLAALGLAVPATGAVRRGHS
jgi:ornithine cyclodeaminase/alanine dehydrogenase-like protein (mu-crystallin family)